MSDVIEIRDLRITTIVGALDHERVTPQVVSLDIDMYRSFDACAVGDDLTQTTNYALVIERCVEVVTSGAFILLETLVRRVADDILAFDPDVSSVAVRVRKVDPPVPQDVATVGAATTRTR